MRPSVAVKKKTILRGWVVAPKGVELGFKGRATLWRWCLSQTVEVLAFDAHKRIFAQTSDLGCLGVFPPPQLVACLDKLCRFRD